MKLLLIIQSLAFFLAFPSGSSANRPRAYEIMLSVKAERNVTCYDVICRKEDRCFQNKWYKGSPPTCQGAVCKKAVMVNPTSMERETRVRYTCGPASLGVGSYGPDPQVTKMYGFEMRSTTCNSGDFCTRGIDERQGPVKMRRPKFGVCRHFGKKCDRHAECQFTPAGWLCICDSGFVGDGLTCRRPPPTRAQRLAKLKAKKAEGLLMRHRIEAFIAEAKVEGRDWRKQEKEMRLAMHHPRRWRQKVQERLRKVQGHKEEDKTEKEEGQAETNPEADQPKSSAGKKSGQNKEDKESDDWAEDEAQVGDKENSDSTRKADKATKNPPQRDSAPLSFPSDQDSPSDPSQLSCYVWEGVVSERAARLNSTRSGCTACKRVTWPQSKRDGEAVPDTEGYHLKYVCVKGEAGKTEGCAERTTWQWRVRCFCRGGDLCTDAQEDDLAPQALMRLHEVEEEEAGQ